MKIKEWNKLVWRLHHMEELLKKAWIKIWEIHPDQHPEAKRIFKENFGEESTDKTGETK